MRAGERRQRITLQKPNRSRNSMNELVDTWADVATVWAAVIPNSGQRFFEALQFTSQVQGVVRIRYRTDVRPEWRLKYGVRYLTIISVVNSKEQDRELLIYYKEAQD